MSLLSLPFSPHRFMSEFDPKSVSLLIDQAKNGCQKSKSDLICQLQSYLQLVAVKYCDDRHQHKLGQSDIVQQSIMIVIQEFDAFRGSSQGELKAWLKQVLINEVRKNARNLSRQKRDVSRERSMNFLANGILGGLVTGDPTPGSDVIKREQLAQLRAAIVKLSPDHAKVIQLRSLDRLSFMDVAAEMKRSEDAVTKLWYRAVLKLQKLMNQDG